MNFTKAWHILLILLSASAVGLRAQEVHTDSVEIHFRVSKWNLDPALAGNDTVLSAIDQRLGTITGDSTYTLRHVSIIGGASPEGSVAFNKFLSEHRAATLFEALRKYAPLTEADTSYTFLGRDWGGVLRLARLDSAVPYRDETLDLLRSIANEKQLTGREPRRSLLRIKALRGGVPYRYLLRHIFPKVRASKMVIDYERVLAPVAFEPIDTGVPPVHGEAVDTMVPPVHGEELIVATCRPFYMDVRTNMLLDAAALPNVGAEFYVGRNFSVGANWMYGWWSKNAIHRFWRAYGGDIFGRWWFGKAAADKPLTGHHVGIYAGAVTFDFEWGGKGYMGGVPGGSLWDRCMGFGGIEYGYSLPVSRRLNIDFTIGVGYLGGKIVKYTPYDLSLIHI